MQNLDYGSDCHFECLVVVQLGRGPCETCHLRVCVGGCANGMPRYARTEPLEVEVVKGERRTRRGRMRPCRGSRRSYSDEEVSKLLQNWKLPVPPSCCTVTDDCDVKDRSKEKFVREACSLSLRFIRISVRRRRSRFGNGQSVARSAFSPFDSSGSSQFWC